MTIFLLTHHKELSRETNTGRLVVEALDDKARIIPWERVKGNAELLECIQKGSVGLLYPNEESMTISEAGSYDSYIVIDSTWQEAQKIYNKSPYLKSLPTLKIVTDQKSLYSLRRNQKENGLCTAEIVIEVLKNEAYSDLAEELQSKLISFLS